MALLRPRERRCDLLRLGSELSDREGEGLGALKDWEEWDDSSLHRSDAVVAGVSDHDRGRDGELRGRRRS